MPTPYSGHQIIVDADYKILEDSPSQRERIATACLQGLLACPDAGGGMSLVRDAVDYADKLIAQLSNPTEKQT
jgi:methylthioribose-1-phosphate isomerase